MLIISKLVLEQTRHEIVPGIQTREDSLHPTPPHSCLLRVQHEGQQAHSLLGSQPVGLNLHSSGILDSPHIRYFPP